MHKNKSAMVNLETVFEKPLLKSSEVAALFGVNLSTVSFWVKSGKLKPKKTIGGNYRFAREVIQRLWEESREEKGAERRTEVRLKCYFQAKLRIGGDERLFNATLLNISDHGMGFCVKGDASVLAFLQQNIGRQIVMIRRTAEEADEFVRGIIMHASSENEGEVIVGIRLE